MNDYSMLKKLHNGILRNMASIYLRKGDQILLLYRQGDSIVSKMWIGSAGGHFEMNEVNDAQACVLREMQEELGLTRDRIQSFSLRYITLRYTNDEIRQNYYFFADLIGDDKSDLVSTEGITRWYSINNLAELTMPFTARHMINHYLTIGQFDDSLYGGLANNDRVIFEKL